MPDAPAALFFQGAIVKNFATSLGWGTSKSSMRIELLEDPGNGYYFIPPPVGTPATAVFGSLTFRGLISAWRKSSSTELYSGYEVVLEDPREILECAEVITSDYYGAGFVANVYNVFGYYENVFGFGSSGSNQGGMPWATVLPSLISLMTSPNSFGGFLKYKGISYNVDFSQLPAMPAYYRINSPTINLMQLIQQICEDGGCDYFIDMIPNTNTIRIRTQSRRIGLPSGVITNYVNTITDSGECISSSSGFEARNEVTSALAIGGYKTGIYEVNGDLAYPYFGTSIYGTPIIGVGSGYTMTAILNSSAISDVVGNFYPCTAMEMCCAISDIKSWLSFMEFNRPDVVAALGLVTPIAVSGTAFSAQNAYDMMNWDGDNSSLASNGQVAAATYYNQQRLYNFVRQQAEEFFGKKFIVPVPTFISFAYDSETLQYKFSQEVSQDGGFYDFGTPLGVPGIYADKFGSGDGRWRSLVGFTVAGGVDVSRLASDAYVIVGNNIFSDCEVDPNIIFYGSQPCVVVKVNNPVYGPAVDGTGAGIGVVSQALSGIPSSNLANAMNLSMGGNFNMKISPLPYKPAAYALAFKSNILTYGPWYASGAQGKVNVTVDNSLTPWEYGGYTGLDLAGFAKVSEAITFQQEQEIGEIRMVGLPVMSIGNQLQSVGPNLTGIESSVSDQGITTTYRFSTFAPKFGTLNKSYISRLQRMVYGIKENGKLIRQAMLNFLQPTKRVNESLALAAASWKEGMSNEFKRNSPHNFIASFSQVDGSNVRTLIGTYNSDEIKTITHPTNSSYYQNLSISSLECIFRPFTNTNFDTGASIPFYGAVNAALQGSSINCINADGYTSGNDIEVYTQGAFYNTLHQYHSGGPGSQVRGFAVKGPLIVCGWGYSVDGYPVPNASVNGSSGFLNNFLRRSDEWKVGPVDLRWDHERRVWTSSDICLGRTRTECLAGGSCFIDSYIDIGIPFNRIHSRTVYNYFSKKIPEQTSIIAAWVPESSKWFIIAADCPN